VAAEGLRPILARDTPPQLAALLEAAWQLQPEHRPTAAQLESELRGVVQMLDSSAPGSAPSHDGGIANGAVFGETGD
jgi:hypothetical protein